MKNIIPDRIIDLGSESQLPTSLLDIYPQAVEVCMITCFYEFYYSQICKNKIEAIRWVEINAEQCDLFQNLTGSLTSS